MDNISQAFRDMITDLLPFVSEQKGFYASFQQPLKKSISLLQHKKKLENEKWEGKSWNLQTLSTLETSRILSPTPFANNFPDTVYVDRKDTTIALWKTRQHLTGQFYIQEVAASLPANIIKKQIKDWNIHTEHSLRILDLCAAPWGKTTQLADFLLENNIPWVIWGNDIDTKRLSTRATNIQRCWLYNTVATKIDGSQIGNLYPEFFDVILVDAPCSGEGTGFKSDAAYKWRRQESINSIVWLQRSIIQSAINALKPEWLLIYSTCTLNPFENEEQITKIMEKYGDTIEILPVEVENKSKGITIHSKWWTTDKETQATNNSENNNSDFLRCRPHIHHTGWFFVCAMKKKTTEEYDWSVKRNKKKKSQWTAISPFSYNKQTEKKIALLLYNNYGIELDLQQYALIEWKHKINLTDASVRELISSGVWFHECGIPIAKSTGNTYSLEHEIAIALWHLASKNTIELTEQEIQDYCLWEDIEISQNTSVVWTEIKTSNWYYILTHKWLGVGIGKIVNGFIKNKFLKR